MAISGDSSFSFSGFKKRLNNLRFRIFFLFQRLKMKAYFLANMYSNEKFSLDVEVLGGRRKLRKQRQNAAASGAGFPHFSGQ